MLLFSVSGRSLRLFKYDVSSLPISVHLPVSRFLAGTDSVKGIVSIHISICAFHHHQNSDHDQFITSITLPK